MNEQSATVSFSQHSCVVIYLVKTASSQPGGTRDYESRQGEGSGKGNSGIPTTECAQTSSGWINKNDPDDKQHATGDPGTRSKPSIGSLVYQHDTLMITAEPRRPNRATSDGGQNRKYHSGMIAQYQPQGSGLSRRVCWLTLHSLVMKACPVPPVRRRLKKAPTCAASALSPCWRVLASQSACGRPLAAASCTCARSP